MELTDLPRPIVRYAGRIPVPAEVGTEIAILKGVAAHLVMKADDRVTALTRQRTLIAELVDGDLGPRTRHARTGLRRRLGRRRR